MLLRIEHAEDQAKRDDASGRDQSGFGRPPPDHVLKSLPGWEEHGKR